MLELMELKSNLRKGKFTIKNRQGFNKNKKKKLVLCSAEQGAMEQGLNNKQKRATNKNKR
jgi:hypothetical protein